MRAASWFPASASASKQIDFDELVTFHAVQHLFDTARSKDERPFFLQVSYTHPHEPYLCRKEFWDLYEDDEIPMPAVPFLPAEEHDAHSVRLLSDFSMLDMRFKDEDIRRARRAYYGSISYLDSMVGKILDVLEATGQADNTAIIFTSDHGEMLGERGMWFKKHFFEPSLRVPLLMKVPGIKAQRVATPASLVDLLPTFMGIAEGAGWASPVEPLDGMDLLTFVDAPAQPDRPIHAEYLAEATTAPILMTRRGRYKYVGSVDDPPLLYDVEADPDERVNLAGDPKFADVLDQFRSETAQKWDSAALTERITLSQRRRRLILEGNEHGQAPRWNHGENPTDKVQWYRGEEGYNAWAFNYLEVKDEAG